MEIINNSNVDPTFLLTGQNTSAKVVSRSRTTRWINRRCLIRLKDMNEVCQHQLPSQGLNSSSPPVLADPLRFNIPSPTTRFCEFCKGNFPEKEFIEHLPKCGSLYPLNEHLMAAASPSHSQQMTSEQLQTLSLNKNSIVFRVEDFHGSISSLSSLKPGNWIDDAVINSLSSHIIQQAGFENVLLIDSLFKSTEAAFNIPDNVASIEDSVFYIILNPGSYHWILAQICVASGTITTFDSFPSLTASYYDQLLNDLCDQLANVGIVRDWKVFPSPNCTKQNNDYDCGIFAIMFLQRLLDRRPLKGITNKAILSFRYTCAEWLLRTTEIGTRLLQEFDGDSKLVIRFCSALPRSKLTLTFD